MKKLIAFLVLAVALAVGIAFADNITRTTYTGNSSSLFVSPDGTSTLNTAITHQVVNMSGKSAYQFTGGTACKFRSMTTATKVGLYAVIPANVPVVRSVNRRTPFVNFTGCTAGGIEIQ